MQLLSFLVCSKIGLALQLKPFLRTAGRRRPFLGSGCSAWKPWRTDSSRSLSSPADPSSPGWEAVLPPDELESYKACNPVHNEPMTRVLQGLVNSTAEVLGDASSGVRAIRLGSDATALATVLGSDTIYERQFFPRLVNRIYSMSRRVVLKGNPGTGTSAFQFYMLVRFLNPTLFAGDDGHGQAPYGKRKFGFAVPPKVVVRELLGQPTEVWFMEHQVVHSITDKPIYQVISCFDPLTTVYFFEPMGVKDVQPYANDNELGPTTLATVPPDKGGYHDFKKVAGTVYMPVWTEEELLAVGRDMKLRPAFDADMEPLYTDDAIRDRFKTYNGIFSHVLPHSVAALEEVQRASGEALATLKPVQFLKGSLEGLTLSHYAAVYNVNESDFLRNLKKGMTTAVNPNVFNEVKGRLTEVPLLDLMWRLQMYSIFHGETVEGITSHVFENVVARHLTSTDGVQWDMRRHVNNASVDDTAAPSSNVESLIPLRLRLRKSVEGEVPRHADMEPEVLYTSLRSPYPFCNMVYKDKDDTVFCIQVSLERDGKRHVSVSAFHDFCARMGWGASPSVDQLRHVSFVYCPEPKLAATAEVVFEAGVGLDAYTVWHVENYDSCL